VGSRIIEKRKFLGKHIQGTTRVVEHEPSRRFVIEASGPVSLRVTSNLAEEDGGTRVAMVVEGDPGGIFRFGERFVVRAARHELRKNLSSLKRILEAASG
jgi:carbon monoxide dehydrogenase subunit G